MRMFLLQHYLNYAISVRVHRLAKWVSWQDVYKITIQPNNRNKYKSLVIINQNVTRCGYLFIHLFWLPRLKHACALTGSELPPMWACILKCLTQISYHTSLPCKAELLLLVLPHIACRPSIWSGIRLSPLDWETSDKSSDPCKLLVRSYPAYFYFYFKFNY